MADVVYLYEANVKQILDSLNQVDKTNEKVWKKASKDADQAIKQIISSQQKEQKQNQILEKEIEQRTKAQQKLTEEVKKSGQAGQEAGEKLSQSAQVSGVQLGIVSGIVQSITTQFINLGKAAVSTLIDISKESIGLASEFETTGKIFQGIFEGNEPAATAALEHIREQSRDLGTDLQEVSRAFLPFVGSLQELDRVNKAAAALAISQPEQGAVGARIALQEALSGNMRSLVQRFEIPKNLGKELQKAFDEGGVEAFLTEFEDIMKRMGRDIDQLTDTFQFSFSRAQINLQQLQTAFGVPITDALKEQFDELNKTFKDNFDDLSIIADTFGRVFANVVSIVGTDINDALKNLDTKQVTRIAEIFFDITEDAKLLADTLSGAKISSSFLDNVESLAKKLDEALITSIQLNALSQAGAAKAKAEYDEWVKELEKLHGQGTITTGVLKELAGIPGVVQGSNELSKLVGDEKAVELATRSVKAGQEAYNKVILDAAKGLEESRKKKEENRKATEDLTESTKNGTKANEDLTNSMLAAQKAADELAKAQDDAAEAQKKIDEETTKAETDFQRQLEDIDIDYERKRTDIAVEFAQKREDAARKNLEKLADIQDNYAEDVDDAALDLSRKEEDIARKAGQDRIDLETENRQAILDIETDYRRKLEDIQSQFLSDSEEAERNRDAINFLRAIRERDDAISQAETDRQQQLDDQATTNEQKLEEQKLAQEREIEEAEIANERKLEDLRTNLDRQIEEQNVAYARELEDLKINEDRKYEEAKTARDRDIEDAQRAYDRKLSDLEASLQTEYETVQKYNKLLEEEAERHLQVLADVAARQAELQNMGIGSNINTPTTPTAGSGQAQGPHPGAIPGFQTGGIVPGPIGQPRLVIAHGGESITPPGGLMMATSGAGLMGSVNNSRSQEINLPLATANQLLDPTMLAMLRNIIGNELAKVA